MNILPLIFAVLLILGLFSQSQLEQYQRFFAVKKQYAAYMEYKEKSFFNERQENLYKASKSTAQKNPNSKKVYNRKLNARLILNKKFKGTLEHEQHCFLLKELMKTLYQKEEKYQALEQQRPHLLDELLAQLIDAAEAWGEVKTISELQKVQIADSELSDLFLLMMKGTQTANALKLQQEDDEQEEDEDDDNLLVNQNSLKNFLHFFPTQTKVSVYLASKPVLEAAFKDIETVNAIIEARQELYKRLRNLKKELRDKEAEIATQELKKFESQRKVGVNEAILDFKVTSTNPNS